MADGAVDVVVLQESVVAGSWSVTFEERNFLRFIDLPHGWPCPQGEYWRVLVHARPHTRTSSPVPARVPMAIRQFDIQSADRLIFGFGPGWHEHEYAPETGLSWRWTSDRSVLQVRGPEAPLRVRLRGESPLKYFDDVPTVTLAAGARVVGRIQPASDFEFDVTVPADAVRAAGGDLVLETSRAFVPADGGSADMRRLGLRIFDVRVERAR
jgi:hypothetical protein